MSVYIYPTDTVWGLGASIFDFKANLRICEIKKTAVNKQISILMATLDDVREYFNLPPTTNLELLRETFRLEATLGFPVAWMQKKIPDYIFSDSTWIGVRYIDMVSFPSIQRLMNKVLTPITTTSLNYSGDAPITSEIHALEFAKKIKDCTVIPLLPTDPPMSGEASCFMCFDEKGAHKLIRAGRFSERLQEYAKRLF